MFNFLFVAFFIGLPNSIFSQESFSIPAGCERSACNAYVQWVANGNVIEFEMEAAAMGWVAMGLSADQVMGGNGIDDVFACQRDTGTDTVNVKDTYNPMDQSSRGNAIDSDQSGITTVLSSFTNGRISCSFTRTIAGQNVTEDRNLDEAAYVLLAYGNTRGAANSALMGGHVGRVPSGTTMTLTEEGTPPPEDSGPSGSFSIGDNCNIDTCTAYSRWIGGDSEVVTFELSTSESGWVAIGVSADQRMGSNGIDDVFACQRDSTDGNVIHVKDNYNPQDQTARSNRIDSSQNGTAVISTRFENGRIYCRFTRTIQVQNEAEDRPLDVASFVLLAAGSARGGANSALMGGHSGRRFTGSMLVLSEGGSAMAGCVDPFIRVHGILMTIAWGVMVPIGIFIASIMRPAMKKKGLWFQVHRAIMVSALFPSLLGFLLIFVAFRGNTPGGLIALGSDNVTGTVHFVFGIIVVLLQIANPLISIFRCKPDAKNRWIFNIVHGVVIGNLVYVLAIVNISLGLSRYATHTQDNFIPLWFWIAVLLLFSITDIIAVIYFRIILPTSNKEKKDEATVEMTTKEGNADKEVNMKDSSTSKDSEQVPWRWLSFGIYVGEIGIGCLVLIVLIGVGCF